MIFTREVLRTAYLHITNKLLKVPHLHIIMIGYTMLNLLKSELFCCYYGVLGVFIGTCTRKLNLIERGFKLKLRRSGIFLN